MISGSSTIQQPLQLPEENAILSFLTQEVLTENFDRDVLEKVAKIFSNQIFVPEKSVKELKLSIGILKCIDLNFALQCCAEGRAPVKSMAKKAPTFPEDNSLKIFSNKHEFEENSFENVQSTALGLARNDQIKECFALIEGLSSPWQKNNIAELVAEFFAKKGDILSVKVFVRSFGSTHDKNRAFSRLSLVFAKGEFIKEAKECISCIATGDIDDPSDDSTELMQESYTTLIEELIKQKKFHEAGNLVSYAQKEDIYRLEKEIKLQLGTWKEPNSVSSKRYWSSKRLEELTIEEFSEEKINTYAEQRALHETDVSDFPIASASTFDFDQQLKWQAQIRKQREDRKQQVLQEFSRLSAHEQCEQLKTYLKVEKFDFKGQSELEDVINYLARKR